jgi:tetratricopeptide (TPR) repeat protein
MLSEQKRNLLEAYGKGLELYKQRDFETALKYFTEAKEIDPQDGPTNLYLSRCETFISNPPPADWDGVFTMTTK